MPTARFTHSMAFVSLMLTMMAPAIGQQFPTKPIRIFASGPGGGTDDTARLIARGLSKNIGQGVVIENRQCVLGADATAKATPDGYTLFVGTSCLWTSALLRRASPYDPVKDFTPITVAASFPTVMFINGQVPANSVKEFIALAKAKPGELNYVITSVGGSAHLAAELFRNMAGINMAQIPYKDVSVANTDLLTGRVDLFFSASGPLTAHVKAGKLKALGVTSAKPSALLPDLPTVASTVPGYEMDSNYCVFAPAKTPAATISFLNREIVKVLKSPESQQQLLKYGFELVASTSEELDTLRKSDITRVAKLIKDAAIPLED